MTQGLQQEHAEIIPRICWIVVCNIDESIDLDAYNYIRYGLA